MQLGGDRFDERQILRRHHEECGAAVIDRISEHAATELGIRCGIRSAHTRKAQPERQRLESRIKQGHDDVTLLHIESKHASRPKDHRLA